MKKPVPKMSNEHKGPWLFRGFVGDEKLPSYMGIIIPHSKASLLNGRYNGK